MTAKYTIILSTILILSLSVNYASALSCAPVLLGDAFDESDYAFHGKVIDKNYLTWELQMPVITFEVIESFKGNAGEQISVTVYEQWSYDFEEGLEYVVFVNRNELSLEISPCSPMFQAHQSSLDIMRLVSMPDHDMRYKTSSFFYESLTDGEKIKYEENNNFLKEKRLERWDNAMLQRNLTVLLLVSLGFVAVFVLYMIFRKRKVKQN